MIQINRTKNTKEKNILFLIDTFGNDADDIVSILEETDTDYYYEDGLGRYCYLSKEEEDKTFSIFTFHKEYDE